MALFGRKNEQDATLGKPPMGWGVPGVQKLSLIHISEPTRPY